MSNNYRPGDKVRVTPWASARKPRDEWVDATITACIGDYLLVKFPNGKIAARSLEEVEPATPQAVPMRDAWATWGAHLPDGSAIVVANEDDPETIRTVCNVDDWWGYDDGSMAKFEDRRPVRLLATLAPGQVTPTPEPEAWEPKPGDLCTVTHAGGHGWTAGTVVQVITAHAADHLARATTDPTRTTWERIEHGGRCRIVPWFNLRLVTPDEAAAWHAKHTRMADVAPALDDVDHLRAEVERLTRELAEVVRDRETDQDRYHEEGRRAAVEQIVRGLLRLGADE